MSVIAEGGTFMYAVLAMGGLGALFALVLTGLGITGRRVPLTAWLVVPVLALVAGALGSFLAAGSAISAVGAGEAAMLPSLARAGYATALLPDWLGRWSGAVGMMIAAWGAGLGAVAKSDDDTVLTAFPAVFSLLATVLFASLAGGYTIYMGLGAQAWAMVGLLAFGGVGVTIGALRRHAHDHAFRVAGMRFASGISLVFAMTWAGRAMLVDRSIVLSRELAGATGANYANILANDAALTGAFTTLIWIGIVGAWAIATANFFAELGEVVQKTTLVDMAGVVALLFFAFVVRAVERTSTEALREIGDLGPLAQGIASYAYDLPAAGGLIGDKVTDARPLDGGFGDAITLVERKAENGDPIYEWKRTAKWNGGGWDDDDTLLAEAALTADKPVLLIAKGGAPADKLIEGVQKVQGQALLLLRVNELQTEGATPEQLSRQGTLLPVQVGGDIDFATTLWVDGDTNTLFAGPIAWFGHGDDTRKLYDRIRYAIASSETRKGLHVITSERTRISDVVNQCLPSVVVEKDGMLVGNGSPCVFSNKLKDDVIAKAMESYVPPETPNLKYSLTLDKSLDAAVYTPLFQREMGAISFCAQRLLETTPAEKVTDPPLPPELEKPVDGKLMYEGNIGYKKKIDALYVLDKSTLENETLRRCINRRMGGIAFPEIAKPEVEPGKEAPPMPKFELTLTFK